MRSSVQHAVVVFTEVKHLDYSGKVIEKAKGMKDLQMSLFKGQETPGHYVLSELVQAHTYL